MQTGKTGRKYSTNDADQRITYTEKEFAKYFFAALAKHKKHDSQIDVYWNSFLILKISALKKHFKKYIKLFPTLNETKDDAANLIEELNKFETRGYIFIALRPDFLISSYGVVIEVNGKTHEIPEIQTWDNYKNLIHRSFLGFALYPISDYDLLWKSEDIATSILDAYTGRSGHKRRLQNIRKNTELSKLTTDPLCTWLDKKGFSDFANTGNDKNFNQYIMFCEYPSRRAFCGYKVSIGMKKK